MPNIHLFHYRDLRLEPATQIRRLANILKVNRFEDVPRHPNYAKCRVVQKRLGSWKVGTNLVRIAPQDIDHVTVGFSALAFYRRPARIALEVMGKE